MFYIEYLYLQYLEFHGYEEVYAMPVREMAKTGHIRSFPKGAVIFREHDKGGEMYIVLKGLVDINTTDGGGQHKTPAEISQGGFFGEMSLLAGQVRKATAVARCDSMLMVITEDNFDALISQNPQLALRIMKGLAAHILKLNGRLIESAVQPEAAGETAADISGETAAIDEPEEPGVNGEELTDNIGQTTGKENTVVVMEDEEDDADEDEEDDADEDEEDDADVGPEANKALVEHYFFAKKVNCPVCGGKFESLMIRESRLKQRERTEELRVLYQDIEPLLHNIWICPDCYYAMRYNEFEKINEIQKKNLANQTAQRKEKFKLNFGGRRTTGFALKAYKIAIECCDSLGKNKVEERIAGMWLNMAWLYDDLQEAEKARQARQQAVARYKSAYMLVSGSDQNDQKIEYLIGKISLVLGSPREAKEYLFKAAGRRNGHPMLRELARDGLEQLKGAPEK